TRRSAVDPTPLPQPKLVAGVVLQPHAAVSANRRGYVILIVNDLHPRPLIDPRLRLSRKPGFRDSEQNQEKKHAVSCLITHDLASSLISSTPYVSLRDGPRVIHTMTIFSETVRSPPPIKTC